VTNARTNIYDRNIKNITFEQDRRYKLYEIQSSDNE